MPDHTPAPPADAGPEALAAAIRVAHHGAAGERTALLHALEQRAETPESRTVLADTALLLLATLRAEDGSLDMVAADWLRRFGRPEHLDAVRALRPKLRPRTALRDWRLEVDRAIAMLQARAEEAAAARSTPRTEAPPVSRDYERLSDTTDRERYAIIWQVRCRSCTRRWDVVEQHGYHYPTFAWSRADADG